MKSGYAWTELIEAAIQVEKAGEEFYRKAADTVEGDVRESLRELAEAERRHAEIFLSLLPKGFGEGTKGISPEEAQPYIESLVNQTLLTYLNRCKEITRELRSITQILDFALGFEEESVRYYESLKEHVTTAAGPVVERVIAEERKHIDSIKAMMAAVKPS